MAAADESRAVIRVEGLHMSFDGHRVHSGLDLTIRAGENYVIIGPSGCGKSVLLRQIFGLLKPDRGRILLWGTDITSLSEEELVPFRRRMALVFQGGALFDSLSVADNVGLSLKEVKDYPEARVREIVREKLRLVNLDGTEDMRVSELSGGMKKRVAIARALAIEPEIIFYDEPTTGLDPPLADTIDELIYTLSRDLKNTTVSVTHDMVAAKYFGERIGLMKDGVIALERSPDDIDAVEDDLVQSYLHRKPRHEEAEA